MDLHEIAKEIAGAGSTGLHLRQGVVTAIAADGTISVQIAGSTKTISGVRTLSSAAPVVGSAVWLAVDGSLVLAIGTVYAGGRFSAYATGSTSLATAAWTMVALAGVTYTDGNFSGSRYTCPVAGRYLFSGHVMVTLTAAGAQTVASLFVNAAEAVRGVNLLTPYAGAYGLTVCGLLSCAAGAVVDLRAWSGSAGSSTSAVAAENQLQGQLLA